MKTETKNIFVCCKNAYNETRKHESKKKKKRENKSLAQIIIISLHLRREGKRREGSLEHVYIINISATVNPVLWSK